MLRSLRKQATETRTAAHQTRGNSKSDVVPPFWEVKRDNWPKRQALSKINKLEADPAASNSKIGVMGAISRGQHGSTNQEIPTNQIQSKEKAKKKKEKKRERRRKKKKDKRSKER